MSRLFFVEKALLADGWAEKVMLEVSNSGEIICIKTGVSSKVTDSKDDTGSLKIADKIQGILLPGISNLHSHAFQRAFAGFSESRGQANDSFWSWRKIMYQFVDKLNPQQVYVIARQVYIEMLKAGYTSVAEFHYLHHDNKGLHYADAAEMSHQVIQAALDVGIEITHLPVYYRYSGFGEANATEPQRRFIHRPDDYFRLIESLFNHYGDNPHVTLGIAPHSLRAVNTQDINRAIEVLDGFDTNAPIHIHIAEQMVEVEDCLAHTGQRPVQHLYDHCNMDKRWCLIHATHINEQETWEMAESGLVAGLCLTTEANLGDGIFPAEFYLQQKGRFGIGSDSHITIDALEELKLLEYGQRLIHRRRAILCDHQTTSVGRTLYQAAAQGGAQALAKKTGKIAIGYQADFLVLDENNPALFSKADDQILDAAIFSSNVSPIKDVMVAGNWLVRDCGHRLESQSREEFRKVVAEILS